ncbi:molecular chaperone HtpG [Phaeovibrio sulfidiphilus]|uniref:Chaperone protein HtpG n=1 Tax=Phaeovibrio sulfidiphilus TaxID=1220600 RepID=A0A8J6YQ69_9PROT|nr:molecular chaperone HtpG [Phaeovibrio sulfidiphilus]MBE1237252.1 molecular chaperone HtpG [Phaeovibrio sulfidiphilus]
MTEDTLQASGEETLAFQAEVSQLLDIVVHSLYSDRQIFLRELISNASDACDKLRYESLTRPELLGGDAEFRIALRVDTEAGTLAITDNGIGMNRQELIANLGTIAHSGTRAFGEILKTRKADESPDFSLIGQFGVGFYSAFMVAERVDVLTRHAGEDECWRWSSSGTGSYTVTEGSGYPRGTTIILHMREDAREFLEESRLRSIVRMYSDHIAIPVVFEGRDDEGKEASDTLNAANALWMRSKDTITPEQYTAFYRHVSHAYDDPWMTLHFRAEGVLEYSALLFVPTEAPFDLYTTERTPRLKLYVNRVFITDDCESLLPSYLRFVRGVVDSSDLSLNVSRELIQQDPRLRKVRSTLTRRLLDELGRRAREDEAGYLGFWNTFGPILKEGIYEDFERKDEILKLARFRTTAGSEPVSIETVIGRMREGQKAVYYLTGDGADTLSRSPQVEGFRARGVEVLLLTDPIDEFWVAAMREVEGTPLRSVGEAGSDLDALPLVGGADEAEAAPETGAGVDGSARDHLVAALRTVLEDRVADVRVSSLLTDSPVVLVPKEGSISPHLRKLLARANQDSVLPDERVLEINPRHPVIRALSERLEKEPVPGEDVTETALLLYDQALILEGEAPADPIAFARRLTQALTKGLA